MRQPAQIQKSQISITASKYFSEPCHVYLIHYFCNSTKVPTFRRFLLEKRKFESGDPDLALSISFSATFRQLFGNVSATFRQLFGNVSATSGLFSNFQLVEQLSVHRAAFQFCVSMVTVMHLLRVQQFKSAECSLCLECICPIF